MQYSKEAELKVFDIVTVGHLSIDSIFLPNRQMPFVVLGGSSAYVSFAARRLESRVGIISKVGGDFPEAYRWWLRQEGIDISALTKAETASTTCFELEYSVGLVDRHLKLKMRAPPITCEDLSEHLKTTTIHVAPIDGEIDYEVVEKLAKHTEVLSLDPQGLVRSFDADGNATLCQLSDRRILELVNVYKSSLKEIEMVAGTSQLDSAIKTIHDYGVNIVLVTLGARGAMLSIQGTTYTIPPCQPARLVDTTGAGDAFVGGFLAEYVRGENLIRCACVGSAAASFVVEGIGPTAFGDKEAIYQRAHQLYEKEIKQ